MAQLGDELVERHAMGERQKQFRGAYMAEISPLYNGIRAHRRHLRRAASR